MKYVHRIQDKFLLTFVAGIMIALVMTIFSIYYPIRNAYLQINEKVTQAENRQITEDVERLISDSNRALTSVVLSTAEFRKLIAYSRISKLEQIYALQEVDQKVQTLMGNNSAIESVYLFYQDWFVAITKNNFRKFEYLTEKNLSDRIKMHIAAADTGVQVVGATFPKEFPLDSMKGSYCSIFKRVISANGSVVVCLNLREESFCDCYRSFSGDGFRMIRLADTNGIIISSIIKEEIGHPYQRQIEEWESEYSVVDAETGTIISSVPVIPYRLVMLGEIPSSVYESELKKLRDTCITVFVFCMLAISVFIYSWIRKKLYPLFLLLESMKKTGTGDYSGKIIPEGNDELTQLTIGYNAMLENLELLHQNQLEAAEELRQLELQALRNEINPHFLYNTLNMLKCMADIAGCTEISGNTVALGSIVATLYKNKDPYWTLKEELDISMKYVYIMNSRYGNQIECQMDVGEPLHSLYTPKMILQPILENAVLHGFAEHYYRGKILISAGISENNLILYVDDDGVGMDPDRLRELNETFCELKEAKGVGMFNVNKRIRLRCGEEYGLMAESSPLGGTRIGIRLPVLKF